MGSPSTLKIGHGGAFNLPLGEGILGAYGEILYEGNIGRPWVGLTLPEEVAYKMPPQPAGLLAIPDPDKNLLHYLHYGGSSDGSEGVEVARFFSDRMDGLVKSNGLYFFLTAEIERPSPIPISVERTAALLSDVDPNKILVYTGAGISSTESEEGGIPTYDQYAKRVGFDRYPSAEAYERNNSFAHSYLTDEKVALRGLRLLTQFVTQLESNRPTEAHVALAKIFDLLDRKPRMVTLNRDRLLTHAGIENVIKLDPGWQETESELLASLENTEVVLVVGLSVDASRRLIDEVRQKNPSVIVVACNTTSGERLSYLGEGDYFIKDDCQKTLPNLYERLKAQLGSQGSR